MEPGPGHNRNSLLKPLPESQIQEPPRQAKAPPIAIVGMACRFPGAEDLEAFWRLLMAGENSVTEATPDSSNGRLHDMIRDSGGQNKACRYGAFVDNIDLFDASFFRISPVEAQLLDPQQRMMLETSWQALEDAGIDPDSLKGSLTGVYSGISNDEYRMLVLDSTKPTEAAESLYALSGTNLNGTAGRVSFVLGLMGPAKAVDAACASALVAVHDAVSDLQQGKADVAIAGGVQAIINGQIYGLRAEAMMLSPEGQCKTFDASADGYVRGEGCGVVVLKRLSDAEADGDKIWAVISGSAVNHGGASVGLTVPHTPALEKVMEAALSEAGVHPSDIDYLEAHGTGTAVGDPIELDAVAAVYSRGRTPDRPLLTGSVKTNIGHLESAAGVAGLIKTALAIKRGVIPKHLHFKNPNPSFDWDLMPVQVTSEMMEWPRRANKPRRAGVNSFGISGTNAHILVEEYLGKDALAKPYDGEAGSAQAVAIALPDPINRVATPLNETGLRQTRFLPLSGKSGAAVHELAKRYLSWLDERTADIASDCVASEPLLSNVSWTAGVGRSHFDHRAAAVFSDVQSLRERLNEIAEGDAGDGPRAANKVAFVYTGQGSQWVRMGYDLYKSEPVARAVLDICETVFKDARGVSLLDVMFGRSGTNEDLGDTAWEQPALYALECALTALWSSVGIRPDVVLGHSVGELAAAQSAGVFSLEDGMRFAEARGAMLSNIEHGAMAAVFATAERVASEVADQNSSLNSVGISIAADNGAHIVVSGTDAAIETITERFEAAEIRARRLNTTRGFHSALVEPALDGLEAFLDDIDINPPASTVVSNLTGRVVEPGMALDGAYWRRHAREPVAFASGVRTLAELGVDLVVEIGPHALLGPMTTLAWPETAEDRTAPAPPAVIASIRRPSYGGSASSPESSFIDAVAEAYEAGLDISFEGLFAGESRRRVSLPSYPFQRERYWVTPSRQRHQAAGHQLLGVRHESAHGEITFDTEVFPSDPAWLKDHRVFGRLVAPGALYGAMAISAALAEGSGSVVLEDMQLHNPLVFSEKEPADGEEEEGRKLQIVLDESGRTGSQNMQIFSMGDDKEWTSHVEGRLSLGPPLPETSGRIDLEGLKARLSTADTSDYYRAKADTGISLGPFFRTIAAAWAGPGEALGEVVLPEAAGRNELDAHPLLLDGCFQVVGLARNMTGSPGEATYLPFGWDRLQLARRLPDRLFCHVRMNGASREADGADSPEVLSGDVRIYDPNGIPIGELIGYTVKRATRAALLSAVEGVDDLLYEVAWRDCPLESGLMPAEFFPLPSTVAAHSQLFTDYLADAEVDPQDRMALLEDLERWSWSRALATLEELGWERVKGTIVDLDDLRSRLNVLPEHQRLFRRLFEMLAKAGVVEEAGDGFAVIAGHEDPLPDAMPRDLEDFATDMAGRYPHGQTEIGLFRRSGRALGDVLQGREDPLTLLFSSGEPTAADLYLKAPVARAANQMLAEAVRALVAELPEGRRLRVIEVGAGTGSATAYVLPELPEGQFEYTYTDISAGFFAEAEAKFGDGGGGIDYRPLDIEKDPISQGFDPHGYDLIIASNVLHATRYLEETLAHCLALLAPSGQLVALENLRGLGWMDLTFGQLDGWWRFADAYRPHHALAGPEVWRQALSDAGFEGAEVLGVDESYSPDKLDKGVIVAQGPAQVTEAPGVWVLTEDRNGIAEGLAGELRAPNQIVLIAYEETSDNHGLEQSDPSVSKIELDMENRDAWRSAIESLPVDLKFNGVVHLRALDGHGAQATASQVADDVKKAVSSALALAQGLSDSDVMPAKGVWFVTRGAQVLERESNGELSGATLWGMGKVMALEAGHLQPRMIDIDPDGSDHLSDLVNELLYPDRENHIAYRMGRRQAARLVRPGETAARLSLPEDSSWVLAPDPSGVFENPTIKSLPQRSLEPKEVRVSVEATGLNFWDVFRSLGFIEEGDLGREMCGRIVDVGSEVTSVSYGDHVVGLGFGAFAPEMVTREELVAPAPEGYSVSELATVPSAFVSADLSYRLSGLEAGERVLIHAGAGGVGLAAIQLAQAAGAEVFATASAPKQNYLRSLGVDHVFDSRQTKFGEEILEATAGEGVHVVLNSLTSEGFIDASLSCLAQGGRFVELARRDILSVEEMAEIRPDVKYDILELDVLKKNEPAWVGEVLRDVMERFSAGELKPIIHSRWPLAEAGAALGFMRSARHVGKIVLTPPPLLQGQLRHDRTYLITGGLGGIGCAVAEWLADQGAGTIVLNGRREPDPEAQEAIEALRERGVVVRVELADVTDLPAVDAMLARIEENLPPLGGIVHSVGVLSDAALTNQTWDSFQQVLWPKVIGAWHLHRSTMRHDLDLFILFSSRVGVMGNPGQANHAAANAFLDQLAGHRRALGLPGQSIAWGAWSEIGEAAEQRDRIERRRAALGGRWFTPQQGIKALERLVRQDSTTSVVMSMDWSMFEEAVEERPPLLEELLSSTSEEEVDDSAMSEDVLTRLQITPEDGHEELLVSFLQQEVQAVLRLSTAPSPTVGFFDLGMDSLMTVELRNRLNRAFSGRYVASNTVVFDYPNIASLARHLTEELGKVAGLSDATASDDPVATQPIISDTHTPLPAREDDIAIVGMACRFPGADGIEAFWRQMEAGENAVTDGRSDSESWDGVVGDRNAEPGTVRRGAFVDDIDKFDAKFFRISPIEARLMDPQQRMMLETSWHALEDAGIDPEQLKGSRTGIYAGVSGSEYRSIIDKSGWDDGYLGTTGSVTVGRVAFALGLEGPAMPIDMACASSLVAIHQAAAALRQGEVDMALAGGVSAVLSPSVARYMTELGILSPDGQCRSFDASANGFVRADGCGIVALKRLRDAEADGDRIWGVIRGSAVNQAGASAGLTVPRGPVQERVMQEALANANVEPSEVDYLEANATGSQMGDPIELGAVASVYGVGRPADRPLIIGTVKTNIGHSESAAGVAGLIKTVLAMNRKAIPKHLHFQEPNPNLDWNKLPLQVATEMTDWPTNPDRPPRAAISAFGISGANSHLLVEGYAHAGAELNGNGWAAGPFHTVASSLPPNLGELPIKADGVSEREIRILPLSGKSEEALRHLARRYLSWIDEIIGSTGQDQRQALLDMAWTASVGRSHFGYRAGLVFRDLETLRHKLDRLAESEDDSSSKEITSGFKTAFIYADYLSELKDIGSALYDSEPLARSVLDRCDATFNAQTGISLLGLMFSRPGFEEGPSDSAFTLPAAYSFGCALTALMAGVGVTPDAVAGNGAGSLAAAQAAGILSIEDGLKIATAIGASNSANANRLEDILAEVEFCPSSIPVINSLNGRLVEAADGFESDYWICQASDSIASSEVAKTLSGLGTDLVLEIGGDEALATALRNSSMAAERAEPPVVISTHAVRHMGRLDYSSGFFEAVARIYEAGFTPKFEGLFAGESPRRIGLPVYPFQRRRYWIEPIKQ